MLSLSKLLNQSQLRTIHALLDKASFVDGKLSAGKEARQVKHNEEIEQNNPLLNQLNQIVMSTLLKNQQFQQCALPLRVASPFYARYHHGMSYGFHVDDPVMGSMSQRYRSDVSTTIFLNEPDQYQGGELILKTPFGEQKVKLAAGDAIVYGSNSLHRVAEVTDGIRFVAVTWAQSLVKNTEQRQLLYDLAQSRENLLTQHSNEAAKISTVYANLVRMWSEV